MRILIAVLLLSASAFAQGIGGTAGLGGTAGFGGGAVAGGGVATDSCTANLLFSWHMESTDVTTGGVAGGVNNGCSLGDTTATASGVGTAISASQFEDGSNSASFPGSNRQYQFTISAEDIIKHTAGTIDVWVRVATYGDQTFIVSSAVDASNQIYIQMRTLSTVNQFWLIHAAGATTRSAITSFGASFSLNTWYHIIAKWDTSVHGSDFSSICADTTTGTTNCGTNTNALGTWVGTLTTLIWGDNNAGGATFFVDNAKVYGTWQ